MRLPREGEWVRAKMGGECGVLLLGRVVRYKTQDGRLGFVLENARGRQVFLFYEDLDALKVLGHDRPQTRPDNFKRR